MTIVEGRLSDVFMVVSRNDITTGEGGWAGNVFLEADDGGSSACGVDLTFRVRKWVENRRESWELRITGMVCGVPVREESQGGFD